MRQSIAHSLRTMSANPFIWFDQLTAIVNCYVSRKLVVATTESIEFVCDLWKSNVIVQCAMGTEYCTMLITIDVGEGVGV